MKDGVGIKETRESNKILERDKVKDGVHGLLRLLNLNRFSVLRTGFLFFYKLKFVSSITGEAN
jgi:hypothetical protein